MGLFAAPPAPSQRDLGDELEARLSLPALAAASESYGSVDGSKMSNALQSVAIGSTVDLICSLGSELPIDVFRGEGAGRQKITTPGYLQDIEGEGRGTEDFIYQVLGSWTLRGNLYADVLQRHSSGYVTQMTAYHPDDVTVRKVGGKPTWFVKNKEITDPSGFLHKRVMPTPGHLLGRSAITAHAATIGVSLASTRFGGQWFTDGAHPTALLTTDKALTKKQAVTAKDRFLAVFRGRREPLVLGNGWDYKPLQMNPEESQFLQTQGYSEAQCARIFGPGFAEILGYESGGNLTYSNIESRATHLLVFGMNRWLRRVDRLLTEMLPRPQYARINRDAMLESTTLTRYQAHALALTNQWKVVNEVRADEDMAPVEWGDQPNKPTPAAVPAAPADGGKP